MHHGFYYLLLLLVLCVGFTMASVGDEQPIFIQCIDQCCQSPCQLTFSLRLLFWTCKENCHYLCMHAITTDALEHGTLVYQYFGKWPFYRWFGIQELASVLFSLGNFWVHYHYYHVLKRRIVNQYVLKRALLTYAICGLNAWVWSTVFHMRDTPWTEKLDYFSAGLLILYSLYYALLRLFGMDCFALFAGCYLMHVLYLSLVRFDYGYNMAASVMVGSAQLVLWVGWSVHQYCIVGGRAYAGLAFISVVGVALAMGLEVLDFPPWRRWVDAHSLWHLATIPLMMVWYRFVLADAIYESRNKATVIPK